MEQHIRDVIEKQRQFFLKGLTRDVSYRIEQLQLLKKGIKLYEPKLIDALAEDLGKSEFESYATEIGLLYEEIDLMIAQIKRWSLPKKVKTPKVHFPAVSTVKWVPKGVVLVIAPWNYPVQLALMPVIGAIAAGNCCILKPSELTPHVAEALQSLGDDFLKTSVFAVINGDKNVGEQLIHSQFDHIFFTGSTSVGKLVMKAAAEHLTPVTLELGGKSPCIVDQYANIEVAAKRIVWGKFLNAGQTCVAPDYLYVHEAVKEKLVNKMIEAIESFYGKEPISSKDYGKIVSERHLDRLVHLIQGTHVIYGGRMDADALKFEPTLVDEVNWHSEVMKEEIFGPILPIMTYTSLTEVMTEIESRPNPLALYIFTEDSEIQELVTSNLRFGGGCINDTISHVANANLPFGGAGASGIGSYHGKSSFENFSHLKSMMNKSTKIDASLKYPPYGIAKLTMLRRVMK